jgi:hypothetical protein
VTAVKTAVSIQTELQQRNQSLDDNDKVQLRIGINIGDVIEDRGEVFGDGVNLAARLEATAPEGGICISATVYEQLAGKLDLDFSDDGEEVFKNINRPVRVYRWSPGDRLVEKAMNSGRRGADKPSIAALEWSDRSLQIPRCTGYWAHAVKAAALANLNRPDEARQSLAIALRERPDLSIRYLEKNLPTKQPHGLDPYLNALRACGLE